MNNGDRTVRVMEALRKRFGRNMLEELTEACPGTYMCRLAGGVVVMARVSGTGKVELFRMEGA